MRIIYILLAFSFFSCRTGQKEKGIEIGSRDNFFQKVEKVSLSDTSRIKELNGKFVEVGGFFYYNFEDVALYPSRPSDSDGALWLDFSLPGTTPRQLENLSSRKVVMTGRINLSEHGHLGAYMAGLDSIFYIREIK